jgi:hypothetical protein
MSETTTLRGRQPEAPWQPLHCRLRPKEMNGRRGSVCHIGEVEVETVSAAALEIAYRMTVLPYLNLVVTDATGRVVSEGHFVDRFAPTLEPQRLRLEPGEKFTANAHLLATVPADSFPPGTYSVRAVYEYHGFRAASEPVLVTV